MKTIQLLFFTLCLPILVQAQITISAADFNFNTSTQAVDFTTVNAGSVTIPQGGTNMVWDYSTLVTDIDFSMNFQSSTNNQICASNLKSPSFFNVMNNYLPSFKHIYYSNDGMRVEGYEHTSANLPLVGITGNPNDNLVFSGDNWHYMSSEYDISFPAHYNDAMLSTNYDTIGYVVNVAASNLVNFGFSQVNKREVSYHINGWGKMLLPNPEKLTVDTFDVLLREKVVTETRTFIDASGNLLSNNLLAPFGYTQGTIATTTYHTFYVKGANYYALQIVSKNGVITNADYNAGVFETLPERIFVNSDANGMKNGISWSDAYLDLNKALEDAKAGDEIWVTRGKYLPGGDTPSPSSSFIIPNGVKVYGGFIGNEIELSQRNYVNNVTILSGDLEADDLNSNILMNRSDNVNHIVVFDAHVTNETVLDGFTFTGGHGDGVGSNDNRSGGAIFSYGSPYIANSIFSDNYASFGGAICLKDDAAAFAFIENCSFNNNESLNNGGAVNMLNAGGTFENCSFYSNKSFNYGGGAISINEANVEILSCTFQRNEAPAGGAIRLTNLMDTTMLMISSSYFVENEALLDGGGAIFNSTASTTLINDCEFEKNESLMGGAIFSLLGATTVIEFSAFYENFSQNSGGAIATFDKASLSVFSTVLDRNEASNSGGAIYCQDTEAHLMNALITNNKAISGNQGGAIVNTTSVGNTGSMKIMNSTIANNHGVTVDGIVQSEANNSNLYLTIVNTIFSHLNGNYSVEYGTPEVISLGGNLSSDLSLQLDLTHNMDQNQANALFVDEVNDNFKLLPQSSAIDAGIAGQGTSTDIEGTFRIGTPDAGAYEAISTGTVGTNGVLEANSDVKTFPNPATDYTALEINNDWRGDVTIQVVNMAGQTVRNWEVKKQQTIYQERIAVDNLTQGTYQIIVTQNTQKQTVSFIKL